MKRKYLYILLALSISSAIFSACKKNDSVETVNTVEETTSIMEIETVTEEMETTTEEMETTTIVEEESTEVIEETTVVVVESTEVIEETTVEEVYSTESVEPEVKSFDEATQGVLKQAKELYEAGLLTKEEYDTVVKEANALNNIVGELQNSQPGHIDKDVPGGTPGDPSKDYQGVRPLVDDPNGANVKIQ